MKKILGLVTTLAPLALSACAALGPGSDEINRLPVVAFGEKAPASGTEYVLRYPAGVDLPVDAKVGGNLFSQMAQTRLKVQLKQDVFVYRDQVSLDGKNWATGHKQVSTHIHIGLPGQAEGLQDPSAPGEMRLEFNLK